MKGDDGHTPGPLAGDTPVRPVLDHRVDPLPAPVGDPLDFHDVFQGLPAQVLRFHGDEPLLRSPVDDRLLAPPAVGIRMGKAVFLEKRALVAEQGRHVRVCLENELALERRGLIGEFDGGPSVIGSMTPPSDSQRDRLSWTRSSFEEAVEELETVIRNVVPELNRILEGAGVEPVEVPSRGSGPDWE